MIAITTQLVQCKDCHRCVRACPVKAIAIENGQAKIVESHCVRCGQCVIECPQEAKKVENQIALVEHALQQKRQVIFSVAPSIAANFSDLSKLWSLLRSKGILFAEETSIAVRPVMDAYSAIIASHEGPIISSCCPAIVELVKKYYPQLCPLLMPVQSPMLVHGQMLKQRYPDSFLVFVGPCIAKIDEARSSKAIDAVITFAQLKEWIKYDRSNLAEISELNLGQIPYYVDRTYGSTGGVVKSLTAEEQVPDYVQVDGLKDVISLFDYLIQSPWRPKFIEAMACHGGCTNGPASGCSDPLAVKIERLRKFAQSGAKETVLSAQGIDVSCNHEAEKVQLLQPSEQEIREILKLTGKETRQDEQNCGACGYNTCRDKAIAVYQGFAELEMCVPFMRQKAESLANLIVEHSLNAIIVVDRHLVIQQCNQKAQETFSHFKRMQKGLLLSEFMDCSDFRTSFETGQKIMNKRVEYGRMKIVTEQQIIPLPDEGLVIGIITDITEHEKKVKAFESLKVETVHKATEIINKQMQVAQEIAGLLGETTGETKSALLELIWLLQDKEDG